MSLWIEQNLNLILSGFIGLAAFLILLFTYFKDLESSKRLDKFEVAIDNLYDEFYKIQKILKNLQGEQEEKTQEIIAQIEMQTKDIITHSLSKTYEHLESIEQRVNDEIKMATNNLSSLDGKIRELEFFSSNSVNNVDEKKILSLLESGKSVDVIAKELGITRGEVELLLQLSNIAYKGEQA
ncbi:DUF6115 domain-containing protein [Helicobacter kayseriensis]|uniref:DUF6115 domain-containing protein n=1 Tax=Helicobacter kayseriensis TaxID=2905877 RepID=UPI001E4487D7|nr:hypothetical protein [Helicobacter kayseriensis]MCE3047562.1 hypothetical protein [Helicobacter kayseriensis]MCE3048884.1 hypothetical protein [Helicobacter kayseriensis]